MRPGAVVEVLPGRQFPAFSEGDTGVVKRVDSEAGTCDVLFDHNIAAGPLPVATRHVTLARQDGMAAAAMDTQPCMLTPLEPTTQLGATQTDVLEARLAAQQHALNSVEARLAAFEASVADESQNSSGRLVAARVAALEASHQAEVNELKRALTDAVNINREQENLHRKSRNSARELEQLYQNLQDRCTGLQETARRLEQDVFPGLASSMQSHERRAQNLKEVVASSETGLSEMAKLLEGQERRTFNLGEALSNAGKELLHLTNRLEDSGQMISDQLRQMDAMYLTKPSEARTMGEMSNKDNDAIWKALRELQELVVHESEHRAAGLREVLGVLGRDTEQLRSDLNRHETEIEGRYKADSLKIRQHITESQSRIAEYDQHTERLEKRLDALSNALTAERNARIEAFLWIEEQVREAHAAIPGNLSSPPRLISSPAPVVRNDSPEEPVNQSLNRIKALEARYDQRKLGGSEVMNGSPRQPTTAAMDKLRGQLDGLRAELKGGGPTEAPGVPLLSPRQPQLILRPAEVVSISSPRLVQAQTQLPPRVVTYTPPPVTAATVPLTTNVPAQASSYTPLVGVDTSREGLGPALSTEADGMDAFQPRVIYSAQAPLGTVGFDLNRDGRADLEIIEGLQSEATSVLSQGPKVTLSTGPAKGYVRPTEYSIATFGSQNEGGPAAAPPPGHRNYCSSCNAEIMPDARFCRMCGKKFEGLEQTF